MTQAGIKWLIVSIGPTQFLKLAKFLDCNSVLYQHNKAIFICPVLKTEWQIHRSIIGERQETAYVLFCYKNGKSAVFKTGK